MITSVRVCQQNSDLDDTCNCVVNLYNRYGQNSPNEAIGLANNALNTRRCHLLKKLCYHAHSRFLKDTPFLSLLSKKRGRNGVIRPFIAKQGHTAVQLSPFLEKSRIFYSGITPFFKKPRSYFCLTHSGEMMTMVDHGHHGF